MKLRTKLITMVLAAMFCLSLAFSGVATENSAPVAENLELVTQDISVGGRLSAVDPDGDTISLKLPLSLQWERLSSRKTAACLHSQQREEGQDYLVTRPWTAPVTILRKLR